MCARKANPSKPYEAALKKAERLIRSAEILAGEGDYDSAASRIYYAMFYVAQALLEELDLFFSSHRAVISAYGQHFAKTKRLDPLFHKALLDAFSQRQLGDYNIHSGLLSSDIQRTLNDAKDFLQAGKDWLSRRDG